VRQSLAQRLYEFFCFVDDRPWGRDHLAVLVVLVTIFTAAIAGVMAALEYWVLLRVGAAIAAGAVFVWALHRVARLVRDWRHR
jgi:predicted MFS family arabinose efflux permease